MMSDDEVINEVIHEVMARRGRGNPLLGACACPGNDFRLTAAGGNEAPPCCITGSIGESLAAYLHTFI